MPGVDGSLRAVITINGSRRSSQKNLVSSACARRPTKFFVADDASDRPMRCSFGYSHGSGFASLPFPGSYLAAVTDFTEMVSPLAVPVTLASSQASLLRLSSAA